MDLEQQNIQISNLLLEMIVRMSHIVGNDKCGVENWNKAVDACRFDQLPDLPSDEEEDENYSESEESEDDQ